MKTALDKLRVKPDVNLPQLTTYSFRHKVTTILRRAKATHGVTEDDISTQLGHRRPHLRTTAGYGEWDPSYLRNAAAAIDQWFIQLQKMVPDRALFSRGYPGTIRRGVRKIAQPIETLGAGEANRTPDPNLGKDNFPVENPQESWLFDQDRMGTDPEWVENKRERNPRIIPDRNPGLATQPITAGPSISTPFRPTKATRHRKIRCMASPYSFRPFTLDDLRMVAGWLETPEVLRWWGDSREQLALIADDQSEPLMDQWLAEYENKPFAYLQAYPARAWPQAHLAHLPATAKVIDVFVGDPTMIGRGHGRAFLREFAEMLIADGASLIATDPLVENHRARRAYSRAGFVENRIAGTADGLVAVMTFERCLPD